MSTLDTPQRQVVPVKEEFSQQYLNDSITYVADERFADPASRINEVSALTLLNRDNNGFVSVDINPPEQRYYPAIMFTSEYDKNKLNVIPSTFTEF